MAEQVEYVRMIDVTGKKETKREAVAGGRVKTKPATVGLIRQGRLAKGNVLAVAETAGIMAAKETPRLIPLCHPLLLTSIAIEFRIPPRGGFVDITATVRGVGKTGFEMEALVAVTAAALTIYDMCKAVDKEMSIEGIRLVKKSGGKSGDYIA